MTITIFGVAPWDIALNLRSCPAKGHPIFAGKKGPSKGMICSNDGILPSGKCGLFMFIYVSLCLSMLFMFIFYFTWFNGGLVGFYGILGNYTLWCHQTWLENPWTEWRFLARKNQLFLWSMFHFRVLVPEGKTNSSWCRPVFILRNKRVTTGRGVCNVWIGYIKKHRDVGVQHILQ